MSNKKRMRRSRQILFGLAGVTALIGVVFFITAVWISDPTATSCANTGGIFLCFTLFLCIAGGFAAMVEDVTYD